MDYCRNSEKRVLNNAGYYLNGQTPCIFKSYNNAKIKNVFKKTITQQQEVYLKLYFTFHLQFDPKSKEKNMMPVYPSRNSNTIFRCNLEKGVPVITVKRKNS